MAVLDDLIKREKVSGLVQMVIWDEYFSKKFFFFLFWNERVGYLDDLGWWRFMWRAKWSERAKHLSHTLQRNGLAPVCLR